MAYEFGLRHPRRRGESVRAHPALLLFARDNWWSETSPWRAKPVTRREVFWDWVANVLIFITLFVLAAGPAVPGVFSMCIVLTARHEEDESLPMI